MESQGRLFRPSGVNCVHIIVGHRGYHPPLWMPQCPYLRFCFYPTFCIFGQGERSVNYVTDVYVMCMMHVYDFNLCSSIHIVNHFCGHEEEKVKRVDIQTTRD